jgi:uncharacterized protein (TIGR03435 family)
LKNQKRLFEISASRTAEIMTHRLTFKLLLATASVVASAAFAQSPPVPQWQKAAGGRMAFDVASIKLTMPGTSTRPNIQLDEMDHYVPSGGLFLADASLEQYVEFAYKIFLAPEQRQALLGTMPKWATTQRFTIRARAAGDPTKDQYRLMMQSLLADRFKMAVHFEKRDTPVLALVLVKPGKLGPFLRATADGPPCGAPGDVRDAQPSPATGVSGNWSAGWPYVCDWQTIIPMPNNLLLWGLRNCTMSCLGAKLSNMPPKNLGRPVVDETGVTGKFDFALEWTYILPSSGAAPAETGAPLENLSGPTLEEALERQLGLKMKLTNAPVDTLVIDHAEMPSEN